MADFDVEAARKSGYSDQEILGHLTQTRKFDIEGARKAGYSDTDIIQHLSSTAAPKSTSLIDKARNVMITGSPKGEPQYYNPEDPKNQFKFPPWLEKTADATMIAEGAYGLVKAAPEIAGGVAKGAQAVGDFVKGAVKPKATGRIAKGLEAVKEGAESRLMKDPTYARLKSSSEAPTRGKGSKELLKYTPGKEPGGGPAKAPVKVTPSTKGGAIPDPEPKSALELSAENYQAPDGKLKQQLLKRTSSRASEGGGGGSPARAPMKAGRALPPETEAAPTKASITPNPPPSKNPIPQEVWDNLKPQEQQDMWAAHSKANPVAPTTSRTVRATPEKQSMSEKIAERNRTTGKLAQDHLSSGETSGRLLGMSPGERSAFMQKHGLKNQADWLAYVHNVLRLEGK